MKLKDSVAIVTGSSSGIGAAIARLLAEHGCHVAINYSNNEDGARAVAADCKKYGVKTLVMRADVAEDLDCRALVDASLARIMGPEVRVNAVCPGFVQGEWLKKGLGEDKYEALLEKTKGASPLHDAASPETVADVCLGLIIGGDLTTGETILIDGGAHLGKAPVRR